MPERVAPPRRANGAAATAAATASAAVDPRPPLVVMLSAAHPPDDVRVVRKEGAALAAAGWRVRHLCPGEGAPDPVAGVAIATHPRPRGWRGRVLGIPALARRARASGAAVLHASEPDAWAAALFSRGFRREPRVVLDVHEHYPSRLDGRLPAALRPLGRAAVRLMCRVFGRLADAVVVAKDGLDGDFSPAPVVPVRNYAPALPVAPRRHAPGPPTLVHTGAMGRARGWPTLLEALPHCPPGTRLHLIGRFTDGSEADFAARAAALGVADAIRRTPWLPQDAALAAVAEGDIGLVLFAPGAENHRLALPHKLFDCMLAGLPVIAPAFAEEVAAVVREAGCGVLIDTGDPRALAAAVAALADPARRAALGAAGRAAALGRFSWAGEAERLVGLYHRLAPLPDRRSAPEPDERSAPEPDGRSAPEPDGRSAPGPDGRSAPGPG